MDIPQWPQAMEEFTATENPTSSCENPSKLSPSMEKKARPEKDSAINCPRCNSTNTKFCYYNNYSLSQPRYFCKTCRRYWTEGGSLRSVPVGGGSRKKKRGSADQAHAAVSRKLPDLVVPPASTAVPYQNPRVHGQDLNLGFPPYSDFKTISDLIRAPLFDGAMNTTKGAVMSSFMQVPDHDSVYSGQLMVPVPEFKIPSLNFSLDAMGGETYGANIHENSSRTVLFPFEDLKTTETTTDQDSHGEQSRDQNGDSNGFWNGMLGGGSW